MELTGEMRQEVCRQLCGCLNRQLQELASFLTQPQPQLKTASEIVVESPIPSDLIEVTTSVLGLISQAFQRVFGEISVEKIELMENSSGKIGSIVLEISRLSSGKVSLPKLEIYMIIDRPEPSELFLEEVLIQIYLSFSSNEGQ